MQILQFIASLKRQGFLAVGVCFVVFFAMLVWVIWPSSPDAQPLAHDQAAITSDETEAVGQGSFSRHIPGPQFNDAFSPSKLGPIIITNPTDIRTWGMALNPSGSTDYTLPMSDFMAENAQSDLLPQIANTKSPDHATSLEISRKFIMSLCADSRGNIWIGTEGNGVQRFEPNGELINQWTQFTTTDGLGDNNGYAIACDHRGRIWVGHLNHGVSVYNGQKWQNYDVIGALHRRDSLSGPLGIRVFSIAICPIDGDVWIATDSGLTRYSDSTDTWVDYTHGRELPFHQIRSITFDDKGNLYVATACEGIAIAQAADRYRSWQQIHGSDALSLKPTGDGLPSNEINQVLATHDGMLYAASIGGTAWSGDQGKTWKFARGSEWAAKVIASANGAPPGWEEEAGALFSQDYAVCLAEGLQNHLYVGYQRRGWEEFSHPPGEPILTPINGGLNDNGYIRTIVVLPDGHVLAGTYGEGLALLGNPEAPLPEAQLASTMKSSATSPLPSAAVSPDLAALNAELAAMAKVPPMPLPDQPLVVSLDDDWLTEGNWLGRYGRYWAALGGILCPNPPFDFTWWVGPDNFEHFERIGPHHSNPDILRRWLATPEKTSNSGSLELPPQYSNTNGSTRRQAQWDDHGESYSFSYEGPDIYLTLKVPTGRFVMSLYEINNDGHDQADRYRDFKFEVKPHPSGMLQDIGNIAEQPVLASARCVDFWNGVYTRFMVQGPCGITVKIDRQYSYNTNLCAIMFDLLDENPPPYFISNDDWREHIANRETKNSSLITEWKTNRPLHDSDFVPAKTEMSAAIKIMGKLDEFQDWNPTWWAMNERRIATLVARWSAVSQSSSRSQLLNSIEATSLYFAGLYEASEEVKTASGLTTVRDILINHSQWPTMR